MVPPKLGQQQVPSDCMQAFAPTRPHIHTPMSACGGRPSSWSSGNILAGAALLNRTIASVSSQLLFW